MFKISKVIGGFLAAVAMTIFGNAAQAGIVSSDTGVDAGNPPGDVWQTEFHTHDAGDSFQVTWILTGESGGLPYELSTVATFDIISFNAGELVLGITVDNTTDTTLYPVVTNNAVMSIGFDVDPDVIVDTFVAGSVLNNVSEGADLTGNFKSLSICVFAAGCQGGNVNDGLQAGDSDYFELALLGDFSDLTAILSRFALKWQGNLGSFEVSGTPCCDRPPNDLPEPGTLALLGMGFAAIGAMGRRRRRAA